MAHCGQLEQSLMTLEYIQVASKSLIELFTREVSGHQANVILFHHTQVHVARDHTGLSVRP